MNMNPDETTLALWLEDDLKGEELAAVEVWVQQHPEHLAVREETRRWRAMMTSTLPASEEPPYPEFFNGRIEGAIRRQSAAAGKKVSFRSILMPLAACAGMALAFLLGAESRSGPPEINVAGAPKAIPVEPIVYTPVRGVKAEWFTSSDAAATVIVLDGVDAIPDSIDLSETAAIHAWREIDATAGLMPEETETPDL